MSDDKPHPDQSFITALASNDRKAVEEIYQRFFPRIRQYILNNSGEEADVADLFQESLIAIFQRARKGNLTLTCPFESYLLAVCKNLWRSALKKQQHRPVTNSGFPLSIDEDALVISEDTILEQERDNFFWQKFSTLGPSCRDILKLSWGGINMQMVAQQLNISYQYARKKKSECISRLMQIIQQDPTYVQLRYKS